MKTDRELLELAAKAAGYSVDCGFSDCPLIFGEDAGPDGPSEWNPLTDDGDALRLAVRLRMCVSVERDAQAALWRGDALETFNEPLGEDENAATRRAIVRAAAAIGDSMND